LDDRTGVYIIAATNLPEVLDPALLRPGRLDTRLMVPLPTLAERVLILETLTKDKPLSSEVDLEAIATDPRSDNFRYFII
jgi:ATP-dependent Zn protease